MRSPLNQEPSFQFYRDEGCDVEKELMQLLDSTSKARVIIAELCGEVSEAVKYPDDYAYDTLEGHLRLLCVAKRQPEAFIFVCYRLGQMSSWTFVMVGTGQVDEKELGRRAKGFSRSIA